VRINPPHIGVNICFASEGSMRANYPPVHTQDRVEGEANAGRNLRRKNISIFFYLNNHKGWW